MALLRLLLFLSIVGFDADAVTALRIPLAASQISLNPLAVQDQSSLWVSRQVNCQLVRFERGQLKLEAAGDVQWVTPKKVRIQLSKNARFHNGKPVLAKDVIASFEYLRESRRVLRNIFEWIELLRAADKRTIEIQLKQRVPRFLRVFSGPNYSIFEADYIKQAKKIPQLWEKPIGCGKYEVSEVTSERISLKPLKNGSLPIQFFFTPNNSVSTKEIRSKKFDIVATPISDLETISNYRKVELFDPYHIFLGLNTQKKPWNKKKNRCALFSSLNREPVVSAYKSVGQAATDILPRGVTGFDAKVDYDKSLKERVSKAPFLGRSFGLAFLTVSIADIYRSAFSQMAEQIYPKTTITLIKNPKQFGKSFLASKADAFAMGLKSNYLDAYEYLLVFKEKDANFLGYWDKNLLRRIEHSQSVEDASTRAAIYREITREVREKCLIYPLVTIPMKQIYVRKERKTPGIERTALNEYFLGDVR